MPPLLAPSDRRTAADAAFVRVLPVALAVLGLLTGLLSPWTTLSLGGSLGPRLALAQVGIGLGMLAMAAWVRRSTPPPGILYPLAAAVAAFYACADFGLYWLGDSAPFNNGLWLLLGAGLLLLRPGWLALVDVVAAVAWMALFSGQLGDPLIREYGLRAAVGVAGGFVVSNLRARAAYRAATVLANERESRDAVEEAFREARSSEERLRTVTEGSPLGIFQTDARGLVVYANQRWCDIAGCDYHDFDAIRRAVHDADRERLTTAWRAAMASGGELVAEFRYVHASGEARHVATHALPLRDTKGAVTGYAGTLEDVTARHEAEDRARAAAAEYRALAENSPDLISRFDRTHKRLYANRSAATARGVNREAMIGVRLEPKGMPGIPAATVASLMACIDQVFASGALQVFEASAPTPAGPRVFETRVVPEFGDDGAVATVLVLSRDITARKEAEQAALESRSRIEEAQRIAHLGSWEWDLTTQRVTWSDEMYRLYGYEPRSFEVTFEKAMERVLPEDQVAIRADLAATLAKPAPTGLDLPPVEYRVQLPDGQLRYLRGQGELHVDEAGKPSLVIGTVQDVTAVKAASEADRVAFGRLLEIEQLREMDRFKTRILSTASHELNTPITPLKLQMHLLRTGAFGPLTPEQEKSVRILERNTDRLASLVSEILDVARLQSGHLKLHPQAIDLAQTVREAGDGFAEPARAAGVTLQVAVDGDLHATADPQRISQVLDNLLSNALKFTPKQGKIRVVAKRVAADVEVRVEDNGLGLEPPQIARLFQPFSQVHDPTKVQRPGTGLGLYICKGIVTEHGGTMNVASAGQGKGSTFWFKVPVQGPPAKPTDDALGPDGGERLAAAA
ncbi:MAG: PAS domain-containing protein [bacterium]